VFAYARAGYGVESGEAAAAARLHACQRSGVSGELLVQIGFAAACWSSSDGASCGDLCRRSGESRVRGGDDRPRQFRVEDMSVQAIAAIKSLRDVRSEIETGAWHRDVDQRLLWLERRWLDEKVREWDISDSLLYSGAGGDRAGRGDVMGRSPDRTSPSRRAMSARDGDSGRRAFDASGSARGDAQCDLRFRSRICNTRGLGKAGPPKAFVAATPR